MITITSNSKNLWTDVRALLVDRSFTSMDSDVRIRVIGKFTEADGSYIKDCVDNVGLVVRQCEVISSAAIEEENRMDLLISTKKVP